MNIDPETPVPTLIEWKDEFRVGVALVDRQHQKLISLINKLGKNLSTSSNNATTEKVLKSLVDYADAHFLSEEMLMISHRYPGYGDHKKQHDAFTMRVVSFQQEFESGKTAVPVVLTHYLKTWLEQHIIGTDRPLGPFLNRLDVR